MSGTHRTDAKRVVVTGLGAVSPFGRGRDVLWRGLDSGEAAIDEFDLFDSTEHRTHLAGQVRANFDGLEKLGSGGKGHERRAERLSRTDRFALSAALEAFGHADLNENTRDLGVFFGCSTGGMYEGEGLFEARESDAHRPVSSMFAAHQNNSPADAIARAFGTTGPIEVISSACSAASMAIEGALQALRAGELDVALAGGADGLCRLTYAGFNSLRAVDEEACRPFREEREGLSIGEGAGVLVLETLEHARARRAAPIAELVGAGSSCDAYHMTAPHPEGLGAAAAIRAALLDSGIEHGDVDFFNLHGTGTPHNDAAEWQALKNVFGERAAELPATSTKSGVGHLLGACGGLEAVATILCLDAGVVHPTTGAGPVDPASPADLVLGKSRALDRCEYAVSANLAFGGANGALVFRRWSEDQS